MKKTIITCALIALTMATKAQIKPVQPPEDTVLVKIPSSKLNEVISLLSFAYQWLPSSQAPANDVQQFQKAAKDVFPLLQPMPADKPKPVITKTK